MDLSICSIIARGVAILFIVVDSILGGLGFEQLRKNIQTVENGFVNSAMEFGSVNSTVENSTVTDQKCDSQDVLSNIFLVFFIIGLLANLYQVILIIVEFCECKKNHYGLPLAFIIVGYTSAGVMCVCAILFQKDCVCKGRDVDFQAGHFYEGFRGGAKLGASVIVKVLLHAASTCSSLLKIKKCCCQTCRSDPYGIYDNDDDLHVCVFVHVIFFLIFAGTFIAEIVYMFASC